MGALSVYVSTSRKGLLDTHTHTGTRAEAEREKLLHHGQDLGIHDQCDLQDNMGTSKQI